MDAQTPSSGESSEFGDVVEVRVRRVPRYGVFLLLGALLGVVLALILTFAGDFSPSAALDISYSPGQVFGFLLLWTVPAGVALGAVVALILERVGRRHDRTLHAGHERIRVAPEHPEDSAPPAL